MSTQEESEIGLSVYQILSDFDGIRRKILKESPLANQKRLYGLTLRQSTAMNTVMLLMKDHPEGVTLKALSEHVEMNSSAASVMVDKMVVKGYLERAVNPRDRRTVNIRLSAKGEEIIESARTMLMERLAKIMEALSPAEQKQLAKIAQKIKGAVEEVSQKSKTEAKKADKPE